MAGKASFWTWALYAVFAFLVCIMLWQNYTVSKNVAGIMLDLSNTHFDYCVQWVNSDYSLILNREDLLWRCYDHTNQAILCDWTISQDTNTLFLTNYSSKETIDTLLCTVKVPSEKVMR